MITEHIMAAGTWELQLRADTPREVLDELTPFALVCIAAGELPIAGAPDSSLLAALRYSGVIMRPGPQTTIGGPGMAGMLGSPDGVCYGSTGARLPGSRLGFSGTDLSFWLSDIVANSGLTPGVSKVQNLAGGPFQWGVTPRQVLDWVADATATEWRINPRLTVDLHTYTNAAMYGTTANVTITRRGQGREIDTSSVPGEFAVAIDAEDYCSKVTVLGASSYATVGGASPYYLADGQQLVAWRVIQDQTVSPGYEAGTASSVLGRYNDLRRDITLTTDLFDVRGEIQTGALVDVWDPATGIVAPSGSKAPRRHRGEWITPLTLRCTSLSWPVRQGMGVYARRWDPVAGAARWTDLAPYVMWETGAAEIGLGANRRWSQL
jgi:hypothetical protein